LIHLLPFLTLAHILILDYICIFATEILALLPNFGGIFLLIHTNNKLMVTVYQVMASTCGAIVGVFVYVLIDRIRNARTNAKAVKEADTMLNDTSYIQDMKHLSLTVKSVLWQQYDFLLASRPYDWYAIVDHADYMESADFEGIESLTIDSPGNLNSELELVNIYSQDKVGLKNFDKLREEQSALAIAGKSRALNGPVKIVWYNQLNVLRVFTTIDNELLIKKYVETLMRRTFGTKDAMKLAKPIPKE